MSDERILVGVDGSPHSLEAVKVATGLARRLGARLRLVSVAPPPPTAAKMAVSFGIVDAAMLPEFNAASEQTAREALDAAQRSAGAEGAAAERVLHHGAPAEALRQLATDPEVSLVVIGARGHGLGTRLVLGSVADRLVQICTKPVLVVP